MKQNHTNLENSTTTDVLTTVSAVILAFMESCKVSMTQENVYSFVKAIVYTASKDATQNSMSKSGGELFITGNFKNWVVNWGKLIEKNAKYANIDA